MQFVRRIVGPIFFLYWFITYLAFTIVWAIVFIIVATLTPYQKANFLHFFPHFWGKVALWLAFSPAKVDGHEKLPQQPCIIISNHQSPFDIMAALALFPTQFLFFSKKEVFQIPLIGASMRKLNYISVDRANARAAAKSLKTTAEKVRAGNHVLIYPEGTRSYNARELLPFKRGTLTLARKEAFPLLPIVVYGTQQVKPMKEKFVLLPHRVHVRVLPMIDIDDRLHPANENTKLSDNEQLEQLRQLLMNAYHDLANSYEKK